MDEKIREALREAYVGEAKAALRLSMFADKAEQEGRDRGWDVVTIL